MKAATIILRKTDRFWKRSMLFLERPAHSPGWRLSRLVASSAQVTVTQSAAPDRPSLRRILQHFGEACAQVELPFRHACDDCISVLETLFVDDPNPEAVAGKPCRNSVGDRIDIVGDQDIHHDAAAGCQARPNGVTGRGDI